MRVEMQKNSLELAEMIDERFAQTNVEMRVHEKVIRDIATLREGRP